MATSRARWRLLLLALLGSLGAASGDLGSGVSRDDDLLQPYPRARTRTARDCAPVHSGRRAHESWPPPRAPAARAAASPVVRAFVSHFAGRAVPGHLTRAAAPLHTFSVLEPGGPGGCASRARATVERTARPAGCRVAQNGGFFRMDTGECLGNVVSDGRRAHSSGGLQNAQFGIRRDGTLVTGYLSEEEVLDTRNPFVQLLSGVVWLIRNGSIYVNESLATECDETQETGSFDKFVNVISARTAVGHDQEGQVVLFHAEGQTGQRGINLWEMAEFLLQQGVVNAINLDGGGSATFIRNGTLASYPSDHCQDNNMWRCPRRVSTVVCVHEPRCQPPDCNGHGLCTLAGCHCSAGWTGSNCSEACARGSFGENCAQKCLCQNGAVCDPVHGACTCPPGLTGDIYAQGPDCIPHPWAECPLGWHRHGFLIPCQCENHCPCHPQTGNWSLSWSPALASLLSRWKQCFTPPGVTLRAQGHWLFTGATQLGIMLVLLLLLLLSVALNVVLLRRPRAQRNRNRNLEGDYAYQPLCSLNSDLLPTRRGSWETATIPLRTGDPSCP